jgi:hypothetical protein
MNAVWNAENKYWILSTPEVSDCRYGWSMTWAEGLNFLVQGNSKIENNMLLTRNPIPEFKETSVRAFPVFKIESMKNM